MESLKNIGPRCAAWLAEIGISTAEELRRIGAGAAYRELVAKEIVRPHLMLLYALACALDGTDCLMLTAHRKREIREEAGLA